MNSKGFGAIAEFFKKDKKRILLVALAVLGVLLILQSGFAEGESYGDNSSLSEYKEQLEDELAALCSSVEGVGKCKVTVSFSEGESLEYRGSTVTGSTPPRVMGVTVVCEGADKIKVREQLSSCMCSLFDIGSNRVCIMKMK